MSDSEPFALKHLLWAPGRTMERPWGGDVVAVVGPRRKRADLLVFGKERGYAAPTDPKGPGS